MLNNIFKIFNNTEKGVKIKKIMNTSLTKVRIFAAPKNLPLGAFVFFTSPYPKYPTECRETIFLIILINLLSEALDFILSPLFA